MEAVDKRTVRTDMFYTIPHIEMMTCAVTITLSVYYYRKDITFTCLTGVHDGRRDFVYELRDATCTKHCSDRAYGMYVAQCTRSTCCQGYHVSDVV